MCIAFIVEILPEMKGMRERVARKLKSISAITNLKQGLVFQVNEQEHPNHNLSEIVPCKITLSDLIHNVRDEDFDLPSCFTETGLYENSMMPVMDHKEVAMAPVFESKKIPPIALQDDQISSLAEPQACNFQRQTLPDNSISSLNAVKARPQGLLSSNLLVSPEPVLVEHDTAVNEVKNDVEEYTSFDNFEEKCPPGGSNSVILYTTSLRGIRKTFEDCSTIRFLLESFRILYIERDVSMHMEFREELWKILGGRIVPPWLFIKGRLIGGADEVVRLHEQGHLRKLIQGLPVTTNNCPCHGCAGIHFILCINCSGSRKIIVDDQDCEIPARCPDCNENGLVQCPICN